MIQNHQGVKHTQFTQRVRNTISNSQLLHYLEEAHNPHITHLQASNPVTFGTSFFLPTGGHSVSNARDPSPIRQYHDDTESPRSDSQSIREDNSQSDSSSDDDMKEARREVRQLFAEADRRSEDEDSSHNGSDFSRDLSDDLCNTHGPIPPWSDDDE
jgi:hypothetical protein